MSSPFLAEIKMFAGNFAPRNYALCNGQLLAIAQNTALFSLLGVNFGGNGTSNFGLPNLQASVPMGFGDGPGLTPRVIGETGGSANVTLLSTEIPAHSHTFQGLQVRAAQTTAVGNLVAPNSAQTPFGPPVTGTAMAANALATAGGSQPHNNQQPFLAVTFIIALAGIFPARN